MQSQNEKVNPDSGGRDVPLRAMLMTKLNSSGTVWLRTYVMWCIKLFAFHPSVAAAIMRSAARAANAATATVGAVAT